MSVEVHEELTREDLVALIGRALDYNLPLVFLYQSSDGEKPRAVRVERTAFNKQGELYLSGTDSLTQEFRSFLAKKIRYPHLLAFEPLVNATVLPDEEPWEEPVPFRLVSPL